MIGNEAKRNRGDGPDVGRDVLAGLTVPSGDGPRQHTLFVHELDRRSVELGFEKVDRVDSLAEGLSHSLVEPNDVLDLLGRVQRQERSHMSRGLELVLRLSPDAVGW